MREGVGCALGFDKLIDTGDNSTLCFRPITPVIQSSMRIIWKEHNVLSKPQELFFKELEKNIG
ncbi:hypothetical protein [Amedibacterium intestinale]|uniref:LysR substrate-binding domain-containing protein n=1 Tax=Amedibacterium intestinale TaxID=2583452 RepID=A0A6N4TEH1_9FIRM|nr:hypothetical protein [Amedibacterium intestinale]BBK21330.1 hypothetical protein Aargi30884_02330 [Amedibacterium intestinale]